MCLLLYSYEKAWYSHLLGFTRGFFMCVGLGFSDIPREQENPDHVLGFLQICE